VYVYQVVVKIPGREALRAHGKFALVR